MRQCPAAGRADDVTALKSELEALKSDYAARIAQLEARISQLETQASASAAAEAAAAEAAATAPAPEVAAAPRAAGGNPATAFNPAMSVILAGNYAGTSQDPATYAIAGFIPSGGEVGPGERSFNLGESELTFAANVDPYFFGNLTASVSGDNEIGVEEAYFRTIALPEGFVLKGGRFFSGFGYLNEMHAHAWDFVDQPLVYQAFFGGQFGAERCAAQVGGADGAVPRIRCGDRQRPGISRHAPRSQRLERCHAFQPRRRRHRRFDQLARRHLVDRPRMPTIAATRTSISSACRS